MEREELIEKAEELGIKVDGRWNDSRLLAEINKAQAPVKQAASKPGNPAPAAADKPVTLPVRLLKNYRPMDAAERYLAGAEIDLPRDEAVHVVATGIAERNDAFG